MHASRGPAATRPPTASGPVARPTRRAMCAWLTVALTLLVAGAASAPSGPATAAAGPSPVVVRYRAPTALPVRLVRGFAAPPQRWAAGHRGIDLALDPGSPVLAPAAGTVAVAGWVVDRGVVTIVHGDGRRSSLEPVSPTVVVGARVAAGEVVATLSDGRSHCAGACLHWGVRQGLDYLDPLTLLPDGGPVVLLPDGR
ncbi:M23 family metallopeptidase [Cellulomonas sp. 73-92]|uniref:M23 family metallopeptidase n=1 Tax=Cellulomonas sp. 73-92 TaxID=1895740 RepID=UPI0025BB16BC|nr:M23 family metallopeptidase [Cellulomonas sp. 73-92]